MPEAGRLTPTAVAALLRRRWTSGHRDWLDGGGAWPLAVLLKPPTERETAADPTGVRAWVEAWLQAQRDAAGPGAELVWTERQWPGLGRQRLPERLVLAGPADLAAWIGEAGPWARAQGRAGSIRAGLGLPGLALGRHFDWLASCPEPELKRLLAAVHWLAQHPDSGLYLRQLPIAGMDTKWLAANRARVTDLLRQVRGAEGDLQALSGLRREPDLLRLRLLDPGLRRSLGGLSDLTAPVAELAGLGLAPARVLLVENLQTGLALPDLPGTVALMARGYAVEVYAALPWLRGRPCHYWGDLDTHGFAILSRLRQHLPQARSLLMDTETLLAHRELWVQEERPETGLLLGLTDEEQQVYAGLRDHRWGPG